MDCHCIKRMVMFLFGLLFCVVIIALIYNTVETWGHDYRTLWVDIPSRLSFLIICCFMVGLFGYFPFPDSLRPDFMPEPILVWKFFNCKKACSPENERFSVQNRPRDDLNYDNVQQSFGSRPSNTRKHRTRKNKLNQDPQLHLNPNAYEIPGNIPESFDRNYCSVPLGACPLNEEMSPLRTEHSGRPNHPEEPWKKLDLESHNDSYRNRRSRANDNVMSTPSRPEGSFRDEIFVFEE